MGRTPARIPSALVAFLAVVLPASTAVGGVLYGLSGPGTGSGTLYTIDPSTGAAAPVAGLSGPGLVFTTLGGLDFLGGKLYATGVYAGAPNYSFGTLDVVTGVFTPVVTQDQSDWHGLAANPAAGVLYTVAVTVFPNTLKSITPTGVISNIGPTGSVDGGGLAYDEVHGILYATYFHFLYRLDTSTGAPTLVGDMGFTPDPAGLAYDPALGVLYLNDGGSNSLYQVDPATGAATFIGANGVSAAINGLPEPARIPLLCAGAVLIGVLRPRSIRT